MASKIIHKFLLFCLSIFACSGVFAQEQFTDVEKTWVTIRWGEGGFRDSRSPLGELGGGQLTFDVRPGKHPFMLSLSLESYTNGPEPTEPFEIADMAVLNLLYVTPFMNTSKIDFFAGGGFGRLKVPRGENVAGGKVDSRVFDIEVGLHLKPYKNFGFYGLYKYLYANKNINNIKLIDFNEHIILIGATFRFGI